MATLFSIVNIKAVNFHCFINDACGGILTAFIHDNLHRQRLKITSPISHFPVASGHLLNLRSEVLTCTKLGRHSRGSVMRLGSDFTVSGRCSSNRR